ncbi:hypothetical protein JYQ62_14050 [Nostoc sp. UHCC 0702]|nr:hypothetical protein JYQ62_14050 [Nostoc sp. UHCC 0702]
MSSLVIVGRVISHQSFVERSLTSNWLLGKVLDFVEGSSCLPESLIDYLSVKPVNALVSGVIATARTLKHCVA